MFATNYTRKTVFLTNVRTINIGTGQGVGYSGAGASYASVGGATTIPLTSTSSEYYTGDQPIRLNLFSDLSVIVTELNKYLYNYSIGNYDYIDENLTELAYYDLTQELAKLQQDANVYPEFENIRQTATRSLEGLKKAMLQHKDCQNTAQQLEITKERAGILDDMSELKKYINSLVGSLSLFPDIEITSVAATLKPEIAIYIKLYGFPNGGVFDTDKLAFCIKLAEEEAENQ